MPTKNSNAPNAKETDLYARKGKLQCIAQLHRSKGDGEKLVVPTTDGAIAAKFGALCNKLFAARGGGLTLRRRSVPANPISDPGAEPDRRKAR